MSSSASRLFLHPQIKQMGADEKLTNKNLRQSMKSADNVNKTENRKCRRKQVFMQDWKRKLDEFLAFNERQELPDAGTISKKAAVEDSRQECERFAERRQKYKETFGEAESAKVLEQLKLGWNNTEAGA